MSEEVKDYGWIEFPVTESGIKARCEWIDNAEEGVSKGRANRLTEQEVDELIESGELKDIYQIAYARNKEQVKEVKNTNISENAAKFIRALSSSNGYHGSVGIAGKGKKEKVKEVQYTGLSTDGKMYYFTELSLFQDNMGKDSEEVVAAGGILLN